MNKHRFANADRSMDSHHSFYISHKIRNVKPIETEDRISCPFIHVKLLIKIYDSS